MIGEASSGGSKMQKGELSSVQPALLDPLIEPFPALPAGVAESLPIAQVLLESAVPHLDRLFDYAVPLELSAKVRPGCRVKVRFSGREMSGYVVNRVEQPTTHARISLIHKLISAVPVLDPLVLKLCEQVANRGAGVTADVVRAAIPPRVARVEKEFDDLVDELPQHTSVDSATEDERPQAPERVAFLSLKSFGELNWIEQIKETVQASREARHGCVVVVPDRHDVERLAEVLIDAFGDDVAVLTADMGPTPRYRAFLRLRFGLSSIAIGTRSAIFAPVRNLGCIVVLDDQDSAHLEPRAPYHHVREVALLRSVQSDSSLYFLSSTRSLEVQRLVERGWLVDEAPTREVRRLQAPRMIATSDSFQQQRDPRLAQARLPGIAYQVAREALSFGPVLVQVARTGFVPAVMCSRCRAKQHCPDCQGPLAMPGHFAQSGTLQCRWCGLHHRKHRCAECGSAEFRAGVRGADRTAQELGRAFPNIPVVSSTSDHPTLAISNQPALVVSTPGVEPVAESGYSAALLLDGNAQLAREGLDVPRQVLARWFRAASLVRGYSSDPAQSGTVVVTADAEELTSSLIRWDPMNYARRELYQRLELGLPPAKRMLSVTGNADELEALKKQVELPQGVKWIGPTYAENGRHRYLLFFSYAEAEDIIVQVSRFRRTFSAQPPKRSQSQDEQTRGLRVAVDDLEALVFD